jgi:radical SAM-linked protein
MARTPNGPPPAPVVQRLRVRYAKRGRLRFTSHRDFQRAFERALRRAGVPVAYSAGFSPHPKVSYAGAAPTGVASEAEYLEVALNERVEPDRLRYDLDSSLPPGLDVIEVVEATGPALADRLEASHWEIVLSGIDAATAAKAVESFLSAETVEVERLTKQGVRRLDARLPVIGITVADGASGPFRTEGGPCAILHVVVRQTTPAVRPDDVLAGLRHVADLAPPTPPLVTRRAQGPLDPVSGTVSDPLLPDHRSPRLPTRSGQVRGGAEPA